MTDKQIRGLALTLVTHEQMNNRFLAQLIMQLVANIPSFDHRTFLEALYLDLQNLPSPPADSKDPAHSTEGMTIAYWKRKIQMAEDAIASGEALSKMKQET